MEPFFLKNTHDLRHVLSCGWSKFLHELKSLLSVLRKSRTTSNTAVPHGVAWVDTALLPECVPPSCRRPPPNGAALLSFTKIIFALPIRCVGSAVFEVASRDRLRPPVRGA